MERLKIKNGGYKPIQYGGLHKSSNIQRFKVEDDV